MDYVVAAGWRRSPAPACDGARPLPWDRDQLGRFVREAWVCWAQTQPNPKPSWLVPYDELSEPDKEADRQIGERVARWTLTDAAAIAATFADAKIVKTRSTLQIILELPIEQADAALKALGGVPQPGRERPVAVALLSPLVVEKSGTAAADTSVRAGASGDQITSGPLAATPAAPTQPPEETPKAPAKQRHAGAASQDKVVARAAILCGDHNFQDWLWALPASDGRQQNEDIDEWTARELRHRCGVKSRRDLAIDGDARKRFLALVERYEMDTGRRAERRSA